MTTNANRKSRIKSDRHAGVLEALCERVLSTRNEIGKKWPYHAEPATGKWELTEDGDWCDGHWIEMLRMTGDLLGRRDLIDEALERTERVRYKLEKDDQFRGHRFYYSAARLWATEREEAMRTLALAAAYSVRSMAMGVNGAMPIGTEVQVKSTTLASRSIVAIDNLHPNLILDWWALKETGDQTFARGARRMFEVVEKYFLRPDGSTIEFIEFDPITGAPLREFTLLGYNDESCWSRGQAWAIAGSLIAYEHTGDSYYLDLGKKFFDYWWNECGENIPPYDFKAPNRQHMPIDTSASGIVTSALARIVTSDDHSQQVTHFTERLEPMLDALCAYVTPIGETDRRPAGMLINGCFNQPKQYAYNHELIWGNFYLMETLYCLEKGGMPC